MTTLHRDRRLNKITFWQNGIQVFPVSRSGNIYTFANGETVLA